MDARTTLAVDVEPGPASEDGLSLRFRATATPSVVRAVVYEDESGLDGWWDVRAVDDADGASSREATTALVEDSSEGTARLVVGGAQGLALIHRASGTVRREAYLLLAADTIVDDARS